MQRFAIVLVVAVIAAMPAMAEDPNQPDPKNDPNQIVCKKQAKVGSRFADKTCHTRAQWDQITEENKRAGAEMVSRALPKVCGGARAEC